MTSSGDGKVPAVRLVVIALRTVQHYSDYGAARPIACGGGHFFLFPQQPRFKTLILAMRVRAHQLHAATRAADHFLDQSARDDQETGTWLVATALIHSLMVTEKRGGFKAWTVLLAIAAFSLSLLGTFLVRSGVLTSVHAFASDPARGVAPDHRGVVSLPPRERGGLSRTEAIEPERRDAGSDQPSRARATSLISIRAPSGREAARRTRASPSQVGQ